MEVVFGDSSNNEKLTIVKTIGSEHSSLTGHIAIERSYDDAVITDECDIIKKCNSASDGEGNCYDWYYALNHKKVIEKIVRFEDVPEDVKNQIIDEYTLDLIEQGVV